VNNMNTCAITISVEVNNYCIEYRKAISMR